MKSVRAVLFDVFGTVVDWRSGVAREAAPFLARHGQPADRAGAFADRWRQGYAPAMEEVRSGRRAFARLDVLHREILASILPAFDLDEAAIDPAELDALNLCWHRLDPWPDAVAGLTRLKAHAIIAPLSNGNIRLMLDMAKRAGLPWDAILGAELVQAYKPMPEAYLRTADVLALRPDEICMVATHESDLTAARSCGLRTCLVPRQLEHGPDGRQPPMVGGWDLVCRDFGELAGVFEGGGA